MSFNIALSGVAAAQKDLDTTANNIANVNTVGSVTCSGGKELDQGRAVATFTIHQYQGLVWCHSS